MNKDEIKDGIYTFAEYENLMQDSEIKYEFHDGRLRSMAGARPVHNQICIRVGSAFYAALEEKGCEVYSSDQAVQIKEYDRYVYPDITVVCEEPDYYKSLYLKNPSVIVEVLSKGTKGFDAYDKYIFYRSLPSLKEYLLVDTMKPSITVHSRANEILWHTVVYIGLQGTVHLPNLDLHIPMCTIYKNIDFTA